MAANLVCIMQPIKNYGNKMKPIVVGLVSLLSLIFSVSTDAALIERGNGLIYDDVLDVTWLQDANSAGNTLSHADAIGWAEQLSYAGFEDWRLPTMNFSLGPNEDKAGYQFSCGSGASDGRYNMDNSGCDFGWTTTSVTHELAHLFYASLGNVAAITSIGTWQKDLALTNSGPFSNLQEGSYWYGNDYNSDSGFSFTTTTGVQFINDKATELYAWALHDGDVVNLPAKSSVAVPAPNMAGIIAMFCCLLGWRKIEQKSD